MQTTIRWLHITDLHYDNRKDEHWLFPRVEELFFKDLGHLHARSGPWDLIIFSGDLAYSGERNQYEGLSVFLQRLYEQITRLQKQKPALVAVPGNHDIAWPPTELEDSAKILLSTWHKSKEVRHKFWTDADSTYRRYIEKQMAGYLEWESTRTDRISDYRRGILPGDFSGTFVKDGVCLGIVGLNTTFLQFWKNVKEGQLAIGLPQLTAVCGQNINGWTARHHASLLITHHPPAWFSKKDQQHLRQEIAPPDRFAVHLYGHMHEPSLQRENHAGGTAARIEHQGSSLFGLEKFDNDKELRIHGYSAGAITFLNTQAYVRFWPRILVLNNKMDSWLAPDFIHYNLDESDCGTSKQECKLHGAIPPIEGAGELNLLPQHYSIKDGPPMTTADLVKEIKNNPKYVHVLLGETGLGKHRAARAILDALDAAIVDLYPLDSVEAAERALKDVPKDANAIIVVGLDALLTRIKRTDALENILRGLKDRTNKPLICTVRATSHGLSQIETEFRKLRLGPCFVTLLPLYLTREIQVSFADQGLDRMWPHVRNPEVLSIVKQLDYMPARDFSQEPQFEFLKDIKESAWDNSTETKRDALSNHGNGTTIFTKPHGIWQTFLRAYSIANALTKGDSNGNGVQRKSDLLTECLRGNAIRFESFHFVEEALQKNLGFQVTARRRLVKFLQTLAVSDPLGEDWDLMMANALSLLSIAGPARHETRELVANLATLYSQSNDSHSKQSSIGSVMRGTFLRGYDFSGMDLTCFDFSQAHFIVCNFTACQLPPVEKMLQITLESINLSSAMFSGKPGPQSNDRQILRRSGKLLSVVSLDDFYREVETSRRQEEHIDA